MNKEDVIKKHFLKYRKLERKLKKSKKDEDLIANYRILHASGLFSNLKHAFTWRNSLSPSDQACLDKYGDEEISKIVVIRQPLGWLSKKAADLLTLGTFDEQIKKLGYDRSFHLFLNIYLSSGVCILTERNETVRLYKVNPTPLVDKAEEMTIDDTEGLTLKEFFQNGVNSRAPAAFWRYTPEEYNCQNYCVTLLQANDLLTPELKNFILQDAAAILSKASLGKRVFKTASNAVARLRFIAGEGLEI